jgi:hypothetical protein
MWQQVVIVLAVLGAAGYVIWTFLSMPARQRLLDTLAARRCMVGLASRHRARMSAPGCSNCGSAPSASLVRPRKP